MKDYYHPNISNSPLYDRSIEVNCLLEKDGSLKYVKNNDSLYSSFINESSTMMRDYIDPAYELKIKTDQYDNKYRCYTNSSCNNTTTVYPNNIGYECNTNMMYKLDEFNTYNNYPVCKFKDNEMICCPENIQIFDNITRRNVEISTDRPNEDLIIEQPIIPSLEFNKCYLYK